MTYSHHYANTLSPFILHVQCNRNTVYSLFYNYAINNLFCAGYSDSLNNSMGGRELCLFNETYINDVRMTSLSEDGFQGVPEVSLCNYIQCTCTCTFSSPLSHLIFLVSSSIFIPLFFSLCPHFSSTLSYTCLSLLNCIFTFPFPDYSAVGTFFVHEI